MDSSVGEVTRRLMSTFITDLMSFVKKNIDNIKFYI